MTPTNPAPLEGGRELTLILQSLHAEIAVQVFAEYAKNQPEYRTLPAQRTKDGIVMTEWLPSAEELDRLKAGKPVRLWLWTFNQPLQPVALEVAE